MFAFFSPVFCSTSQYFICLQRPPIPPLPPQVYKNDPWGQFYWLYTCMWIRRANTSSRYYQVWDLETRILCIQSPVPTPHLPYPHSFIHWSCHPNPYSWFHSLYATLSKLNNILILRLSLRIDVRHTQYHEVTRAILGLTEYILCRTLGRPRSCRSRYRQKKATIKLSVPCRLSISDSYLGVWDSAGV